MVYGYVRVSTEKQTCQNQKLEIRNYCKYHKLKNIKFISEIISGTKAPEKRKLGELLKTVEEGDVVIIAEISRLGRSLMMILNILQKFLEKGVKVIAIKEGYELGDNIQSKVLAFAFGLSAEIERNLISERTKAGLERVRKEGKKLGRPQGPSNYRKLNGKTRFIRYYRLRGMNKSELARKLDVTWVTLNNYMKYRKIV